MPQRNTPKEHLAARAKDRKRILIVEDEAALVSLLRNTFQAENFEVLTAATGRTGLEVAFLERPDLIILDILMPEMDGLTILRRIRRDRYKWGKYVPIIILSNLSNPETIAQGVKYADDYLIKADWTLANLVQKVKEKLQVGAVPTTHITHKSQRLLAGT
jgi:DNA-binding response OmpR family regulator